LARGQGGPGYPCPEKALAIGSSAARTGFLIAARQVDGRNQLQQHLGLRLAVELSCDDFSRGHRLMQNASLFDHVRSTTDKEWLRLLQDSANAQADPALPLPAFPEDAMQTRAHGHSGAHAIREAFMFFAEVKQYAAFCGCPIHPDRTILDFGTGWGRMARMFMKDIQPINIYGCDNDWGRITAARRCNPQINFIHSHPLPPSPFRSDMFDYVVTYSVFSHLDEFAATKWIRDLARITRPLGLIVLTTEGAAFFDLCADARRRLDNGEQLDDWKSALAKAFPDLDKAKQDYENGQFIFSPTRGRPPRLTARYGDAAIPEGYVRRAWTFLDLIDFVDVPNRLPQAMIVLQKPLD
jgi:SAM-dependent methyltransferase